MKKTLLLLSLLLPVYVAISQPTSFTAHGLSGGGAQYAPSINPANPAEIYVACDMSGLYHSSDTGNSWNILSFLQVQAFHPSMVQFTNNPSILYCMSFNNNTGNGYAIKSTDGGTTWSYTTDATNGNGAWLTYANPQNSNQLIVSDYSDLYFSNDGGNTFGPAFYTDTTGAGAYIAGTFFDGNNIYICTNIGLMISTNAGISWSKPTMPGINAMNEWIVSFAGAKSGNTTRFFCITQGNGDVYVGETGDNNYGYKNVYSMDYGITNWTIKETGILTNDLPFFVGMAANNINVAYLAGNDNNTQYPEVLKTSNAGASWTHVFNTATNQNIQTGYCGYGGDLGWDWDQYAFGFTVCSSDSNDAVLTGEGFSHVTTNGGKTWQDVYAPRKDLNAVNASTPKGKYYHPNGMEVTSQWDLMWADSLDMFSGCTDITGIRSINGGNTWSFNYTGLGYNTVYKFAKNPANNVIYAATSSIHDLYESTHLTDANDDHGSGEIACSTDGGTTFNTMHDFNAPVIWLALDPTNPDRMYASVVNYSGGKGGIWISNNIQNNATSTWTQCTAPARTEGHPFNIRVLKDGSVVASYSARINKNGKFTDSSGVFISTNQGTSWTDRSDAGMEYWTMDIVIDPWDTSESTWYCGVFDNWGGPNNSLGGLYRTTNRGINWTRIDTLAQVYSISFDPVNKGQAYITTQQEGLYFSPNIEAASPTLTLLKQYPFRQPNRVYFNPYNPNEIWVNSFGNGLQMGSLIPINTGIGNLNENEAGINVYPNPSNGKFTIQFLGGVSTSLNTNSTIEIYNVLGEKIYSRYTIIQSLNYPIDLSSQPGGVYIYRVINQASGTVSEGKLVIER